eukprot:Clim_evm37s243 gene=Clim_evmTU37s243
MNHGDDTAPRALSKREQRRRDYELDEARKAGTALPERDEKGEVINPHLPKFIRSAPWYADRGHPSLSHQRKDKGAESEKKEIEAGKNGLWYKRGREAKDFSDVGSKFRKGACENCGAMGHKRKDCLERPRKRTAKGMGTTLTAEDMAQPEMTHTFESKRDRYAGYDPKQYKSVVQKFALLRKLKNDMKKDGHDKREADEAEDVFRLLEGEDPNDSELRAILEELAEISEGSDDDEEDRERWSQLTDAERQEIDALRAGRGKEHNLRLREDTAKYLRNLDPDSAHYDPKSRSMQEDPYSGKDTASAIAAYHGDNFERYTGEVKKVTEQQVLAWELAEKGKLQADLFAEPTRAAQSLAHVVEAKEERKREIADAIREKYGDGGGAVKRPSASAETEEPDTHGHTEQWASWNDTEGNPGYACCHNIIKNSICTGQAGRKAQTAQVAMQEQAKQGQEQQKPKSLVEEHEEQLRKGLVQTKTIPADATYADFHSKQGSDSYNEMEVQDAMKRLQDNTVTTDEPTHAELEAYRRLKQAKDDPMAVKK